VFSSTTACIHASEHPQERCILPSLFPTHIPSPSTCLYPSPSFWVCIPSFTFLRFWFALFLLCCSLILPIAPHTTFFHTDPYLSFACLPCFVFCVFSSCLGSSLQKISSLRVFLFSTFSTHLIFDTSPQVVSKNSQLKSANTWSSLKAIPSMTLFIGWCLHVFHLERQSLVLGAILSLRSESGVYLRHLSRFRPPLARQPHRNY